MSQPPENIREDVSRALLSACEQMLEWSRDLDSQSGRRRTRTLVLKGLTSSWHGQFQSHTAANGNRGEKIYHSCWGVTDDRGHAC